MVWMPHSIRRSHRLSPAVFFMISADPLSVPPTCRYPSSAAAKPAALVAPIWDPPRRGCVSARAWSAMVHALRNLGRPGVASMAISAVDVALWDLHARLLDAPLVGVLGAAHESVPVYGSGGFTPYTREKLQEQLAAWVAQGIP